jgi:hypothetical protein
MQPVTSPDGPAPASPVAAANELPDVGDDGESGDRISVTDVNGTVARFEMAYTPPAGEKTKFGPPLTQRLPSILFLVFAVTMVAAVYLVQAGPSGSYLFRFIVEGDRGRPFSAQTLSFIVLLSAIGTVFRAQMRGVIVRADGLEARYLLAFGIPKLRKWSWTQLERVVLDDEQIMIELWNGQYERLPAVSEPRKLGELLERICAARKIRVTRLPSVERGGAR